MSALKNITVITAITFAVFLTGCSAVGESYDTEKSTADKNTALTNVRIKDTFYVPTINEDYQSIYTGTFNNNVERLASELGFTPVIWDERVSNCVWEQVTEYIIPETEPKKIIAYYAETQDFKPLFSNVDSHVRLMYVGPLSRIQGCQDDE